MDLDFTKAKLRHQSWRLRLRRYLEGQEQIDRGEAVSPHECALGKWLYSDGLSKYGHWPEMATLESVHAQMHSIVGLVIRLKEAGDDVQARAEYEKVLPLSREIVSLLEELEKHGNPGA